MAAANSFDIERIQAILKEAENSLQKVPQLKKIRKATGVKIVYLLGIAVVTTLFLVYVLSGLRALSTIVGVIYPGYMSLKAIKSEDKQDDTFWLSYWVIYGLFSAVEAITDLFLFWIPFYELLKILFYFYLFSPQFRGALTIYYALLEPLVGKLISFEATAVGAAKGVKDSITKNMKKGK